LKLIISKNAVEEITESQDYYNRQQNNLGNNFKSDVQKSIDMIYKHAKLYPLITPKIRRSLLHRFPFSIFYSIVGDVILILSVAHQHRKPKY